MGVQGVGRLGQGWAGGRRGAGQGACTALARALPQPSFCPEKRFGPTLSPTLPPPSPILSHLQGNVQAHGRGKPRQHRSPLAQHGGRRAERAGRAGCLGLGQLRCGGQEGSVGRGRESGGARPGLERAGTHTGRHSAQKEWHDTGRRPCLNRVDDPVPKKHRHPARRPHRRHQAGQGVCCGSVVPIRAERAARGGLARRRQGGHDKRVRARRHQSGRARRCTRRAGRIVGNLYQERRPPRINGGVDGSRQRVRRPAGQGRAKRVLQARLHVVLPHIEQLALKLELLLAGKGWVGEEGVVRGPSAGPWPRAGQGHARRHRAAPTCAAVRNSSALSSIHARTPSTLPAAPPTGWRHPAWF